MPDVHAVLGASSAHRWIPCPPSALIEREFPDRAGEAAREGTLAHSIVETKLTRLIQGKRRGKATAEQKRDTLYTPAMEDHADSYVDFVEELFGAATKNSPDAILCSEMRVDFSRWVPGGFGTTDTVIIADDVLTVVDFKFGKGHRVDAEDNPQLRLYALGAYSEFSDLYDIKTVRMYIVQPRLDSISSEEMSVADLLTWADEIVRPAAELASIGAGELNPGDAQCLFCKAKPRCVAYTRMMIDSLRYKFKDPQLLTAEVIAIILERADRLASWASTVKSYALAQASSGEQFPGYKLVRGRSVRRITDETAALAKLREAGYSEEKLIRLRSLTDLEDLAGKKVLAKVLDGLIIKQEGKPTLVPDTDKREPIETTQFTTIEGD